jgi:hypothetical protein
MRDPSKIKLTIELTAGNNQSLVHGALNKSARATIVVIVCM